MERAEHCIIFLATWMDDGLALKGLEAALACIHGWMTYFSFGGMKTDSLAACELRPSYIDSTLLTVI